MVCAFVFALVFCAVLPAVGFAATITVTTTADPVSPACPSTTICSLRGAVAAAGNGDVVMLGAGTYSVTQSQILITAGITIQGTGSGTTIIDASASTPSNTSRAFKITGASQLSVTLEALSITGATLNDTGRYGGGAGVKNNSRATLFLRGVRIFGNVANVDASAASPAQDDSQAGGGGLWSNESVELIHSSVDHNSTVVTNSGVDSGGGGIFISDVYHGNLLLQDSTVANNVASITSIDATEMVLTSRTGGGGVYVAGNDLQLINSTIADNVATARNSWGESGGGGAYVTTGDVTATNSSITGNSANVAESLDTTYLMTGNHGGGGIYQDGHDIDLVNTSISGNATTVTEASDLTTCAPTYATPWCVTNGGGGIYQYGNRLTITGSTLSSNTATVPTTARSGGGGLLDNGNSSYITNTTITGNTAVVGLPVGFSENGFEHTGINEANGGGGILYITVRDGITLANNTIAGNAAPAATGGGVLGYRNPNLDGITQIFVSNTIIATNTSSVAGTANCDTTVSGTPEDPNDPITPDAVFTSLGYNLASDASCNFAATGDLIANPVLGVLQNNGGPTATMALSAASPAVNAGNPTGCTTAFGGALVTDQRGVVRPQPAGGRCDIGSYELAPAIATTDKATVVRSTAATLNGSANNPDALGGTTYFQYGTSTKYGKQTTSVTLGAAISATESATLTKLTPGTYHFRIVTVNAVGTAYGADQVFTTKKAVPPRLSISARRTASTGTTYTFRATGKLSASTTIPAAKRCTGSVVVRATQHGRFAQARTVKLASNCTYAAVFTIPSQRLTTSGAVRFRAQFKGNTAVGKRRSGTTTVHYGQTHPVTG